MPILSSSGCIVYEDQPLAPELNWQSKETTSLPNRHPQISSVMGTLLLWLHFFKEISKSVNGIQNNTMYILTIRIITQGSKSQSWEKGALSRDVIMRTHVFPTPPPSTHICSFLKVTLNCSKSDVSVSPYYLTTTSSPFASMPPFLLNM